MNTYEDIKALITRLDSIAKAPVQEDDGANDKATIVKQKEESADSGEPFPEGDEFDINEDEDFEQVLGVLGFPEDEIWEAEYRGRKV